MDSISQGLIPGFAFAMDVGLNGNIGGVGGGGKAENMCVSVCVCVHSLR